MLPVAGATDASGGSMAALGPLENPLGVGSVVAAVNVGGSAYTATDGTEYSADEGLFVVYGGDEYTIDDDEVANTADDPLYATGRTGKFGYDLSVPNGEYVVTFHFAEPTETAADERVFDLGLEGDEPIKRFDPVNEAGGAKVALDVQQAVTVTDGELNVFFDPVSGYELPAVAGFRVSSVGDDAGDDDAGGGDGEPDDPPTASFTTTIDGLAVAVDGSGSSDDGTIESYAWSFGDGATGSGESATHTYAEDGTYTVELTVTDDTGQTATTSEAVTVAAPQDDPDPEPAPDPQPGDGDPAAAVAAVNIGGDAYTADDGTQYAADEGLFVVRGADTYTISGDISGTTDDPLYATGRTGKFGYDVPVPNGEYVVTFHFAEPVMTETDERVFDLGLEGDEPIQRFDVVAAAGGSQTALDVQQAVTVSDGELRVFFDPVSGYEPPAVAGFRVDAVGDDAGDGGDGTDDSETDGDGEPSLDSPPTASFSTSTNGLSVSVDASGSSDDSTIQSYAWTFDDGTSKSGESLSHTYTTGGTYTIELTVVDDAGQEDTTSETVSVSTPETGEQEPHSAVVAAVNIGGPAYTASDGTAYSADEGLFVVYGGDEYTVGGDVEGTVDDPLYATGRTGKFGYEVSLPDGEYVVTFHLAEPVVSATGERVFDIGLEGSEPIQRFDIVEDAGGQGIATEVQQQVVVDDGTLDILFDPVSGYEPPAVAGFRVERQTDWEIPSVDSSTSDLVMLSGETKRWHKVTLTFDGPMTSEDADPNPFTDYRLDVTFTGPSGQVYVVPGYYAADGNAAETSATSGNKWRAHLMPDEIGEWTYEASFVTGAGVAVSDGGTPTAFDGVMGSFSVSETDKTGRDFRGKGKLAYVGEHYYQFQGTGEYFLKTGAGSPENLLAYEDFDGTWDAGTRHMGYEFLHAFEPHVSDWEAGDPTWQGGKGKGIIGAMNYLSSEGVNSHYFLTYTAGGGDGGDVWPWVAPDERQRYDTSKLDQWEVVFGHMTERGVLLNVFTQETENAKTLNEGDLGVERKLYYRELVARFGHHPAVFWNLGEESERTAAQHGSYIDFISDVDPYESPITVSSYPGTVQQNRVFTPLLGTEKFTGPSLVSRTPHDDVRRWRSESELAGLRWVVEANEMFTSGRGWRCGLPVDGEVCEEFDNFSQSDARDEFLWGSLLAGAGGVEWYFGFGGADDDIRVEDYRTRDQWWDYNRYAREFLTQLPFHQMAPADETLHDVSGYGFARAGSVYVYYLATGGEATVDVEPGVYSLRWYDPKEGTFVGDAKTIEAGLGTSLGVPPVDGDVVALLEIEGTSFIESGTVV